jgi:hypothetical protein
MSAVPDEMVNAMMDPAAADEVERLKQMDRDERQEWLRRERKRVAREQAELREDMEKRKSQMASEDWRRG